MTEKNQEFIPARQKHSLAYWILIAGLILFSAAGWMRLGGSIVNWYWLNYTSLRPGPLYLAVTGGIWGAVGLTSLIWILFRLNKYRLVGSGAALLYAIMYWMDRLLYGISEQKTNPTFSLGMTVLLVVFVVLVLRPWIDLPDRKG